MATVNIIIKGIAMSYHKGDGLWKILFPVGECHETKFKEGAEDPGMSLAGEDRQIRITTENASSEFEIGDNYYDFLDLTADYSHVNGVRLKDDWAENAVLMTIESAKVTVYEYTETEHILTNNNNTVTFAPARIGYSAMVVIDSEKVIIDVDNHSEFPRMFDQDCTLIFDNDCENGALREISDFDLAYNVVEDADTAVERFVVTKVPEDIDSPILIGTIYNLVPNEKTRDPFARGLPCHMVRISMAEYLL